MHERRWVRGPSSTLWQATATCRRRQRHAPTAASLLCRPAAIEGVFRPGLLETGRELKAAYDSNAPYPHCVIKDICNPDLLRKVGAAQQLGFAVSVGAAQPALLLWALHTRDARLRRTSPVLPAKPAAACPALFGTGAGRDHRECGGHLQGNRPLQDVPDWRREQAAGALPCITHARPPAGRATHQTVRERSLQAVLPLLSAVCSCKLVPDSPSTPALPRDAAAAGQPGQAGCRAG